MNYLRLNKIVVLFQEIGRVKIVLSLTRPHGRMCIRMGTRIRKKPKKLKKNKLVTRISGNNRFFCFIFFCPNKETNGLYSGITNAFPVN